MTLLTIPEITKQYGISRFRIMRAVEAGELQPPWRIGYTLAFTEDVIRDYADQLRSEQLAVTEKDLRSLKLSMRKAGVSQAALARKLGVSSSYISHVLSGRATISRKQYRNLSQSVTPYRTATT